MLRDRKFIPEIAKKSCNSGISAKVEAFVPRNLEPAGDENFQSDKNQNYTAQDAGLACQTFCLAAHEQGLATVILGIYDEEKLPAFLGLGENEVLTALIVLGYGAQSPDAPKRKSAEELIRYV